MTPHLESEWYVVLLNSTSGQGLAVLHADSYAALLHRMACVPLAVREHRDDALAKANDYCKLSGYCIVLVDPPEVISQ